MVVWESALVVLVVGLVRGLDEDLQFDEPGGSMAAVPVRRQWGVPDQQAVVGKLFIASIPQDAFSGDVEFYEPGRGTWPRWLQLSRGGVMKGVPGSEDLGVVYLMVRAVGPHGHHYSKDTFAIDVIKSGFDVFPDSSKKECRPGMDPIMLTVLMDIEFKAISPARRVKILETFSNFYGLPQGLLYLRELTTPRVLVSLSNDTVIMAGPGNVKPPADKDFASLSFQVGCGRDVNKDLQAVVQRLREDSADGTLAEVLQLPVVGWHARNELPVFFRDRREVAGSGDFYEEEDDEDDYGEPTTQPTPHPHRHHHGEEEDLNRVEAGVDSDLLQPSEVFYHRPSNSLLNYDIISTPAFVPERPTAGVESTSIVSVDPTRVTEIDLTSPSIITSETDPDTRSPVTVPVIISTIEANTTTVTSDTTQPETIQPSSSSATTSSSPSSPHRHDGTSPDMPTDHLNQTWTTAVTTEEIEPETKNFPPTIAHRLKKVVVTAGKLLQFQVPENTFIDVEDGTASHMAISFTSMEGKPPSDNSWIMFNQSLLKVIGLPLEEHVSKWEFLVEAKDRDGDTVSDTFQLQVQQHKGTRTVNHEFTLTLTISRYAYPRALDWQLAVLHALTRVYGDRDPAHITVRSVSLQSEPVTFTWTNDSLPRSYCPREDIERLLKVISASEDGLPTAALEEALGAGITVRRVSYQGIENCESKVLTLPPPPETASKNFPPLPRNQIDQINGTAGQLLVFRVPEDTFYDPEDGGTRKLKMSLLNMDRSPLSPSHWLQFDSKNQDFYGLPMDRDVRSQEYQLVCNDRAGLTATDGLLVLVRPRVHRHYSVEFSIALDISYEIFSSSAAMKRKFVEKIQEVFGDPTPDAVVIGNISAGSTIVTWFNSSLPTDHCPEDEIHRLRKILINDNQVMSDRLVAVMMSADLPVISVGLEPAGKCQGELTVHHRPEPPTPPTDESHPLGGQDSYIITLVIPASVIALMLILAGLIACLFYRKRRASKMGIGDEDERQSFRSKGIPVIFQDELEEKPEPENKNPVIMKEEKPPLPPPEYQRAAGGEDAPYHPPPPFPSSRDSGRHARPKPTPTYRKPPPYVPP